MTQTQAQEKRSAWKDLLTAPNQSQLALTATLFFFSCLILPFSDHETAATVYLFGAAVFYYMLNRTIRALLYYALPALFLYGLSALLPMVTSPLILPCAFLALVLGGSSGAFLLTHFHDPRKHSYLLLLPIAAYGLSAAISGSFTRALLVLLPTLVAVCAAVCMLKCVARTDAIVLISATLAISAVVAGLVTMAVLGWLSGNPLTAVADATRAAVITFFRQVESIYAEAGMPLQISSTGISNLATTFVNITPALFLCVCSITGFLIWHSLLTLLLAYRSVPRLPLHMLGFSMSKTSACVFLTALVVSLFANYQTVTAAGMVCQNIYLTLTPGLALIGVASLFSRGPSASCLNRVIAFGLIFLMLYNPVTALTLSACFGAVNVLAARLLPPQHGNNDKGGDV